MEFPLTLLNLAGTIALLLWGVRMVQTGIQRAFGPRLRGVLGRALRGRGQAFLAGLGVTAILQSSTATGLMVAGFTAEGLVGLVPALAVMLGANVGTTLIVQLLSFDVAAAAPALILLGVLMFRRSDATMTRDLGRVFIGLGLMLMSLHQLLSLVTPFEDSPSLRLLMGPVSTEPVLALLLAAGLTWAAHSSVAVVLLVMSLAAKGVLPPHAAFALVLGANLGTAVNPVLEGASGADPAHRRLPLGNLLNRGLGCAAALAALPWIGPLMVTVDPDISRAVADFHTVFNLALAAVFFPLLGPWARLLARLLPARVDQADPGQPIYLDPAAKEAPAIAVGSAAREALRLADVLETMLAGARDALAGERRRVAETKRMDDVLDRLNTAIKAYVTSLDPEAMTDSDHRRVTEILAFAMNLEHAGDVVGRNLMASAGKLHKRGLVLSPQGRAELDALLERVLANLRAAAAVFMTGEPRGARLLAGEKEAFRELEAAATAAHLTRLRERRADTAETSAIHLDLIRDLKRVNAHLVAAAAYPVLQQEGDLLPSRLRTDE